MEKEIKKLVTEFCDSRANEQFENNDKQCGTAAQLQEGDKFTIVGGTYVENVRTYESAEAADKARVSKIRQKPQEDGSVKVDNSYYAIVVDNAPVATISLRTLTSWAQLENCPEDAYKIPAGRASAIFAKVAPLKGKTFAVTHIEEWGEGETHNEREQQFAGRAIAIKEVVEG